MDRPTLNEQQKALLEHLSALEARIAKAEEVFAPILFAEPATPDKVPHIMQHQQCTQDPTVFFSSLGLSLHNMQSRIIELNARVERLLMRSAL